MSAKAKQLIIIYTAAALVTLSVLSAVLYSKLADYRLTALYSSSGAFETTVSAVDGLSRSLKKSPYRRSASGGRSICTQAYANALPAEAALSALPFSTQELEQLSGFLNRAGDYAKSLGAQSGDKLSDEQKQHVCDLILDGGFGAFCLTEPGAGSDASAGKTTAVKDGDE